MAEHKYGLKNLGSSLRIGIFAAFILTLSMMVGVLFASRNAEAATASLGAGSEVKIPELGVRLELPSELKDLTYFVDSTSVPGTKFIYFSTASLESLNSATSQCAAKAGAIGAAWMVAGDPKTAPELHMNSYKPLSKSYLVYQAPQSGCSSDSKVLEIQATQIKLLQAAISQTVEGN